ncbi:integral membrane protein, partial [Streptomyces zinciresistens K42]
MRTALRRTTLIPQAAAAALLVLLALVVARLPWAGDLGMHAATVERLRHSLLDPGNPLVDADTPSPYYSPWTLLLGSLARVGGLSVFVVLRIGALVALAVLVTGVRRYVRTLSAHRAAPALALLCLLLLWGTSVFTWSGFLGLNSLALTASYPSVLALGLAFHLWASLTGALARPAGWPVWTALGVLWAVILLVHQFSGVVASLGALATVAAAR